jgi:hypothetical protein
MKLETILRTARQWFSETPERALDQAYRAALKIKEIEDSHFQGQKISAASSDYGDSVIAYFRGEVKRNLQIIKMRLVEFNSSRSLLTISENAQMSSGDRGGVQNRVSITLEKLRFIDSIKSRYEIHDLDKDRLLDLPLEVAQKSTTQNSPQNGVSDNNGLVLKKSRDRSLTNLSNSGNIETEDNNWGKVSKTPGVLPRSFMNTINRIKQEIAPESEETEEAVLKRFRKSRYKTAISIKFILLLIIVPLLTHQIAKTFFLSPVVESYFAQHQHIVFINNDLEEEALIELQNFEEALRFKGLIGIAPKLSQEETESALKSKALEISQNSRDRGVNAIANIFADLFSLIGFAVIVATNQKEIVIVKSFMDEILYNLSDSAKAFLIILFTDIFVGFHSPHGWEVVLESTARHFGLPENRDFNFLFIATFPVILDTVFKYWIFRYLNRLSPSSVATYRNMNE